MQLNQSSISHMLRKSILITLSLGLLLGLFGLAGTCRAETVVIPVNYRSASEVVPIVKGMLSPGGTVTFAASVHSLVVTDTAENIQRVQAFLETFDTAPLQVRIRLKFTEKALSKERSIQGKGRVSGNGWSISTGGKTKDGVEIQADDRKEQQQQTNEHILVTTSGTPAYILTGVDVPYRQRWIDFCRRYAVCTDTIEYRRIDTGMEILPMIVGDHAIIEITPRISRMQAGDPEGVIRFTRASTRLSIPLNQWVEIGGTDQSGNEVLSAILERGSGNQESSMSMSIRVETF